MVPACLAQDLGCYMPMKIAVGGMTSSRQRAIPEAIQNQIAKSSSVSTKRRRRRSRTRVGLRLSGALSTEWSDRQSRTILYRLSLLSGSLNRIRLEASER